MMNNIISLDQAARDMLRMKSAIEGLLETARMGEAEHSARWAIREIFSDGMLENLQMLAKPEHLPNGNLRLSDGRIISSVTID